MAVHGGRRSEGVRGIITVGGGRTIMYGSRVYDRCNNGTGRE